MAILEVRDLRARYSASGPEILKGISLKVEANDFFAIIGPSGAGKSTLVSSIPWHLAQVGTNRWTEALGRLTPLPFILRELNLDDLGGFDERYFLYFEETDFCLCAQRAGWPTWYLPESRVEHIGAASTGWRDFSKRRAPPTGSRGGATTSSRTTVWPTSGPRTSSGSAASSCGGSGR